MDANRDYIKLVIGGYAEKARLMLAWQDLSRIGLAEDQLCTIGSGATLNAGEEIAPPSAFGAASMLDQIVRQVRKIGGRDFRVSSVALFDRVWMPSFSLDEPLTRWMTPMQSVAIWRNLCDGNSLLLASASSTAQLVNCSRIQLSHQPTVLQAYNFAE